MNKYRSAALALVTCVAGLSLAACSAGVTSVASPATSASSSSASSSSASSSAGASSAATAAGAVSTGSTVHVGGSIGSFPIPPGARVTENGSDGKQYVIILSSVSPAKVSSFYTAALPRDGYKITNNSLATVNNGAGAEIEFTGHGYRGTIGAVSGLATQGVGLGNGKNFVGITLDPAK